MYNWNTWQGPPGMPFPSAQMWLQRMAPSEREGYRAMLEQRGAYWPDFDWQMRRLWPSSNISNFPMWRPVNWWR